MAVRFLPLALLAAVIAAPAGAGVMTLGSSSASLCYQAAESSFQPTLGDLRQCETALTEEALTRHDRVATHVNRGILRLKRGQLDLAIADFDTAIRMDPAEPEAYLNKGAAMIRQSDSRAALGLFGMAIERRTSRPELAFFGRAVANEALGHARQAYEDYRRASELAPEWEDPKVELSRFRVVSSGN